LTGDAGAPQRGNGLRLLAARRDEILEIARRHGATNVRVFGSVARGTDSAISDIDLLVDLPADTTPGQELLIVGGLAVELTDLLGRKVDVATIELLRDELRSEVTSAAVPV
jgi:predicted nucleotidyltransferase